MQHPWALRSAWYTRCTDGHGAGAKRGRTGRGQAPSSEYRSYSCCGRKTTRPAWPVGGTARSGRTARSGPPGRQSPEDMINQTIGLQAPITIQQARPPRSACVQHATRRVWGDVARMVIMMSKLPHAPLELGHQRCHGNHRGLGCYMELSCSDIVVHLVKQRDCSRRSKNHTVVNDRQEGRESCCSGIFEGRELDGGEAGRAEELLQRSFAVHGMNDPHE